jgi:hypothetical protein
MELKQFNCIFIFLNSIESMEDFSSQTQYTRSSCQYQILQIHKNKIFLEMLKHTLYLLYCSLNVIFFT